MSRRNASELPTALSLALTVAANLTLAAGLALLQPAPASAQVEMSCLPQTDRMPLEGRRSPFDSLTFKVAGHETKICYNRPSARGRTMIGGRNVPFGQIWRTGANEPTLLRASADLDIAGIHVPAGTYSLYTVPGKEEWEIVVNRSYTQWGHERFYTDEIKAQEVGRGKAPSEAIEEPVETFTIRAEETAEEAKGKPDAYLILEWEKTRVRIPISVAGS